MVHAPTTCKASWISVSALRVSTYSLAERVARRDLSLSAGAKPHPFRPKRKHNAVSGYTILQHLTTLYYSQLYIGSFFICFLNWQVPTTCQPSNLTKAPKTVPARTSDSPQVWLLEGTFQIIGNRYGIRWHTKTDPPIRLKLHHPWTFFRGSWKTCFIWARKGGRRW